MNFWDTITGNDMTREFKAFEARVAALPEDYRRTWEQIKTHLFPYSDFTGRNLMPILDATVGLLEETAAEGLPASEAIGDDVEGFCAALTGGHGAQDYRERWRRQLNRNVARKLGQKGN